MADILNIINAPEVEDFLNGFSIEYPLVRQRFNSLMGRLIKRCPPVQNEGCGLRDFNRVRQLPVFAPAWLRQKWDDAVSYHKFVPSDQLKRDSNLILLWLEKAVQRQEKWVLNDALFISFLSLDPSRSKEQTPMASVVERAESDLKDWHLYHKFCADHDKNYRIVHQYKDGYVVVEILTEAEMINETRRTQVCVGAIDKTYGMTHIVALRDNQTRYFSLRDPHDDGHATISIFTASGHVMEIKGKQNKPVMGKYDPYILSFLNSYSDVKSVECGARQTGIFTHQGKYHSYRRLPEGAVCTEDTLDLSLYEDAVLPQQMEAKVICLNGDHPPSIPMGVSCTKIHLQWRKRDEYIWKLHRDDGPADIAFARNGRVIYAHHYNDGGRLDRRYTPIKLEGLAHLLDVQGLTTRRYILGLPSPS